MCRFPSAAAGPSTATRTLSEITRGSQVPHRASFLQYGARVIRGNGRLSLITRLDVEDLDLSNRQAKVRRKGARAGESVALRLAVASGVLVTVLARSVRGAGTVK